MASPVIDPRMRLRNAGMTDEQAGAIAAAFDATNSQIRTLVIGQRIEMALPLVVTGDPRAVPSDPRPLGRIGLRP